MGQDITQSCSGLSQGCTLHLYSVGLLSWVRGGQETSLQHSAASYSLHTSLAVHCRSYSFSLLSPSPALGVVQLWTTVEMKASDDDGTRDNLVVDGKDDLLIDDLLSILM